MKKKKKPELILKKLKILADTQRWLHDWLIRQRKEKWLRATKKVRAATAAVRGNGLVGRFSITDRAQLKKLMKKIGDNALALYCDLNAIVAGERKKAKKKARAHARKRGTPRSSD